MQTIRSVGYGIIKQLNIRNKALIFPPDATYYVLEDKDIIKSVLAVRWAKDGVKLQGNYTLPEYRNKGLFSELLSNVLNIYKGVNIYADCLLASRGIYLKHGFKEYKQKQFKNFKIYYMEMGGENGKETNRKTSRKTNNRDRPETI